MAHEAACTYSIMATGGGTGCGRDERNMLNSLCKTLHSIAQNSEQIAQNSEQLAQNDGTARPSYVNGCNLPERLRELATVQSRSERRLGRLEGQ